MLIYPKITLPPLVALLCRKLTFIHNPTDFFSRVGCPLDRFLRLLLRPSCFISRFVIFIFSSTEMCIFSLCIIYLAIQFTLFYWPSLLSPSLYSFSVMFSYLCFSPKSLMEMFSSREHTLRDCTRNSC